MYNVQVKETTGTSFTGGINEGVSLHGVELVQVTTSKYVGPAIDVTFEKDGSFITSRRFPVNPERVRPGMTRATKNEPSRPQTMDEAIAEEAEKFVMWFKSVVNINFCTEEQWTEAMKDATSLEKFYAAIVSLLPEGYEEKKGKLICGYSNNNYIEVPREHWITRTFFTVDDKKPLVVSHRIKTTPTQITPSEAPSVDTAEDDLWV
jgi:hypothetical protein